MRQNGIPNGIYSWVGRRKCLPLGLGLLVCWWSGNDIIMLKRCHHHFGVGTVAGNFRQGGYTARLQSSEYTVYGRVQNVR